MVTLYVGGQRVAWADAEKLFAEAAAKQPIEFHDESGRVFATSYPKAESLIPWEPEITQEEIDRRMAELVRSRSHTVHEGDDQPERARPCPDQNRRRPEPSGSERRKR